MGGLHLYTCKTPEHAYVCLDDKLSKYNKDQKYKSYIRQKFVSLQ